MERLVPIALAEMEPSVTSSTCLFSTYTAARLDDEIANQHTKGDQYPAVGQGSQNLAQIVAGRHKAHISTGQKQNQPDISIKQADQNFAQRFAAHVQDGKLINAKKDHDGQK